MARGDHVFVRRWGGIYSHHGIDCGDDTVIHYSGEDWERPTVRQASLERFANEDEVDVRSYGPPERAEHLEEAWVRSASERLHRAIDEVRGLRAEAQDLLPDAVIARAESRLGEGEFDFVFSNCEHFACWCKTGLSSSRQVEDLWRLLLGPGPFALRRAESFMTGLFDDSSATHWRRWLR